MDRLTNNIDYCQLHCDFGKSNECFFQDKSKCYEKNIYEKLREYEDLEEQELLLRLQFKIGQKVYYIYKSCIDRSLMIGSMIYRYSCLDFPREYFATKEEAEQKLKEMESE